MSEQDQINGGVEYPLLTLKELEGNNPTQLYGIQPALVPYSDVLYAAWWFVFFITVMGVMYAGFRAQRVV